MQELLSHLPLGPIEFHASLPSTNALAMERLDAGAPDFSLIVADEQTAGRGRAGRRWHTPAGAALAFSLVLRPAPDEPLWAHAPLAALAVHGALTDLGLAAAIKWPNDVLIDGRKVCGVLAETRWQGDAFLGAVLGTGVNVLPEAVPQGSLPFPATSVSAALGSSIDRWALLASILEQLLHWRTRTGSPDFIADWEERLAFRGEKVVVGKESGTLVGLAEDGCLQLRTARGIRSFPAGDLSLRPTRE